MNCPPLFVYYCCLLLCVYSDVDCSALNRSASEFIYQPLVQRKRVSEYSHHMMVNLSRQVLVMQRFSLCSKWDCCLLVGPTVVVGF